MKINTLKTIFASLSLLLSLICCADLKAENYLGVGLGYSGYNNGAYAKLDYQHSFSRLFRIAPEIGYAFRNNDKSAFECAVDLHMPVRVAQGVKFYPLAGLSYNNWTHYYRTETGDELTDSHGRMGVDLGGGLDIYMTSRLKIQFQGKYSLLGHYGGCFIDLGVGYLF